MDLACLGNHEFDHGDDTVDRCRDTDDVNGNEKNDEGVCDGDEYYFPGIRGDGIIRSLPNTSIKVGIFGLITNVTAQISSPSDDVRFDACVTSAARRICRSLRERGADIIVALTHLREEEDVMLARDDIAGIDLILGGHEHEPLALLVHRDGGGGGIGSSSRSRRGHRGDERDGSERVGTEGGGTTRGRGGGHQDDGGKRGGMDDGGVGKDDGRDDYGGILVFKTGMNAYWVGTVDLDIIIDEDDECYDGRDVISSISTSWSMHAVDSTVPEDDVVSEIVRRYRKETEAEALITSFGVEIASSLGLDDVVATVGSSPYTSTTSTSTMTMPQPLDTRMSSVRRRESTGGNLVADAMRWMLEANIDRRDATIGESVTDSPHPMLSMINGGFIRGDRLYPPGCVITARDVLTELPFPRTMTALIISGKHLREALAQQLRGSSSGPTGAFPHLSSNASLRYSLGVGSCSDDDTTDDHNDEVRRIISFTVDGIEVPDEGRYIVAVTSFVAEGSEGCTSWSKGERLHNSAWDGINMSCVLLKYLQHCSIINPVLEGRVKLRED
ncbi:hypothetical protein ACHAXA_004556 [Cyclostephanos tholiformis]|uniref:5'-Nucleotidase C-terminal domain-containing protein n=1 Tax=Cyclostephanos tholiformis TaxID=382380 RepID=A0ABD3RDF7_9STRA